MEVEEWEEGEVKGVQEKKKERREKVDIYDKHIEGKASIKKKDHYTSVCSKQVSSTSTEWSSSQSVIINSQIYCITLLSMASKDSPVIKQATTITASTSER